MNMCWDKDNLVMDTPLQSSRRKQWFKMNEDPWKTTKKKSSKKEQEEIISVKVTDISFFVIFKSVIIFLLVTIIILPMMLFVITALLGISFASLFWGNQITVLFKSVTVEWKSKIINEQLFCSGKTPLQKIFYRFLCPQEIL